MPSYEVIKPFRDKYTGDLFGKGAEYFTEDEKRAKYLQEWGYIGKEIKQENDEESDEEIKNEDDEDGLKHVGGGYYELPNGEKVKGKQNAIAELEKLKDGE
ncbi:MULTISPECIES: hypothetical protein [Bacillota]|uniref:Uncharacterized protein n=1 Tax=Symbiobacterium thermophilum TaxID=2734 RepID=A0A953I7Z7_SYMTR|nr:MULTISPECIES: hypothetical protein [Bacillota]MBY6276148.1 hypothetical protein [Symbiobacterium thermophilum]